MSHRCVWVGGRGPGGVELCGVDGGVYVAVRVWRGGRGVSADAYAADLARALADLAGPDVVLEAFDVATIIEHLKRRVWRVLEDAKRRYLGERRRILESPVSRGLLSGQGNGFVARGTLRLVYVRVGPLALRLVTLQRLLEQLGEWLDVYRDVVGGRVSAQGYNLYGILELVARADRIAGVEDGRLFSLVDAAIEKIASERLRRSSGDCRGYECVERHPEAIRVVLAG